MKSFPVKKAPAAPRKKARDLNAELVGYLASVEKDKSPVIARKTEFATQRDGRVTRTITTASGRIVRKQTLTDAASARLQSGMTQAQFAALMGVSLRTLQEWEQGRKDPSGAAKTLLAIAMRRPDVLLEIDAPTL